MKLALKHKIALLFISGAFFLGFTLFFDRTESLQLFNQRQAVKFVEKLRQESRELENQLAGFAGNADSLRTDEIFRRFSHNSVNEEDRGFYVYSGDSLVFWSHNLFPVPENVTGPNSLENPLRLDNGWYISVSAISGRRTYLALQPIKFEYPHQNTFLKDHFAQPFELNNGTRITFDLSSADFHVKQPEGLPAFGLIYPDSNQLVPPDITIQLMFFAGIIFLFYALWLALNLFWFRRFPILTYFLFGISLILVRVLMMQLDFPGTIYSTSLFGPGIYASSEFFPSLGDFLLNSLVMLVLVVLFPVRILFFGKSSYAHSFLGWSLIMVFAAIASEMGRGLVIHSSISFLLTNVLSLSGTSIAGLLAIVILLAAAVIFSIRLSAGLSGLPTRVLIIGWLASLLLLLVVAVIFSFSFLPFFLWPAILTGFLLLQRMGGRVFSFGAALMLLILFSVFSAYLITDYSKEKERRTEILLAERLSAENDPVAEYLFIDLEERIFTDELLDSLADDYWKNQQLIEEHLQNRYFNGYWEKYEFRSTLCSTTDSLIVNPGNYKTSCLHFFDSLVTHHATPVSDGPLFFLKMMAGRISYLSRLRLNGDSIPVHLFVELHSKFIPEGSGYPELLLDEQEIRRNPNRLNFAFARYHKGKLINSSGTSPFSTILPAFVSDSGKVSTSTVGETDFIAFRSSKNDVIILSRKAHTFFDDLTTFSYFFSIYSLLTLAYFFFWQLRRGFAGWLYRFRTRIQLLFIGTIILSIVLFGLGTVFYIQKQYREKNDRIVGEKLRSVLIELEQKLGHEERLTQGMKDYIGYYLVKFSNVFFADINLYDLEGSLLASSRPEIFEQGLISSKMNPEAFHNLNVHMLSEFIHEEEVGKLEYLSAYVPFRNSQGSLLAYLNLPYFAKQNELEMEISSFLVALINIYVLLLILSVTIAVLISNYVTRPVQLIREKMRRVQLGSDNEPINWKSKDELGSLIREYNRMIRELSESAEQLARSERESAWREMAKQVAHEIKNPLTPMKLSIQHLQRAWNDGAEDFDQKLERISRTLIEQIDALSSIATEFSNFAKMPRPVFEVVDLVKLISGVTDLHRDSGNVKVNFEAGLKEAYVFAGRESMLRVFNNLLKNSIQAIPEEKEGKVLINLENEGNFFLAKITDNGSGIPEDVRERIFEPNFTTKTAGMGLGLAMVKNIVEMTGGEIWFETRSNTGTTFFVRLPVYAPEKEEQGSNN